MSRRPPVLPVVSPPAADKTHHSAAFVFMMQSVVSVTTMVFCAYMISRSNDNISTFLPILTSTAAYWLPAPSIPQGALAALGARRGVREDQAPNSGDVALPDKQSVQITPNRPPHAASGSRS